ncbi:hypothetical protein ACFQI3_12520 [Hansschlegelia quercus]|uniref:Uncharacterized protein n=1 Tax=Hansschlegelia quercus TaxID=2528245 RepID=A0A4Q9GNB3_9HYPH|nr:hypothetical protein [Hansschlegelia quercus]TBN53330.1 hypothetical protein EYR15_09920 [Hansschlegelia quercus]
MLRSFVIAALALAPLAALAEPPLTLTCDGPIGRDAIEASLIETFGKANVRTETIDGAEGEQLQATVLFPDDPARRIQILWSDEAARKRPSEVRLTDEAKGSFAGLSVGLDLTAVEKLNGRPFVMNGFGWDLGGNVVDWKGGALSKVPGDCGPSVQFNYAEGAPEKALDKVSGDKRVSSADKALRVVKPTVSSVSIGWGAD